MKTIAKEDLENLAIGAAILGSGGGGSPSYNQMITEYMIETHGNIKLISIDDLHPDDLVVPVAFMGAPLVALEKIPSGREFTALFHALEKKVGKRPTVLLPAEIGGGNAFTPLWVAAMMGLPVLDADTIGRAFPELQMSVCTLHGVTANPAFLADCLGNVVTIETNSQSSLERIARHTTMAMGSRAAVAMYLMNGSKAKDVVIKGSISKAIDIGRTITAAKRNQSNPTEALIDRFQGHKLASGTISDVDHKIEGGFLKGKAVITTDKNKTIDVLYQNEFLIAQQNNHVLATTPDIIMLIEQDSGLPITSANVDYGIRVDLITLPSPEIWRTSKGLELVGPRYFGYDIEYNIINKREEL